MATPDFPRVKSLKLRNFKGIAELDLEFDESLTLLAGTNGAGKTSILQALLAAVTRTWWQTPPNNYPRFEFSEDIRRTRTARTEIILGLGLPTNSSVPHPSSVELSYEILQPDQFLQLQGEALQGWFFDNPQPLPLVVYYEQSRVFPSNGANHSVSSRENRGSSLQTTISSPSQFKSWFFEKEADEGQEVRERKDPNYEDPELANVRKLLNRLDGFSTVRSRKLPDNPQRILFLEKEDVEIPFDSLSGGEQAFFMLAADLARRLMLESPERPVEEAPGIVCIDEIELHLHPAWQKRILTTLMETFPACQFVVTTHSPQVISGVEARHVRLLKPAEDGRREVCQPIATKGRDSNFVLSGVLETPERADEVDRLFDAFDESVDGRDLEAAERTLRELDKAVEGQSAAVATRQAKLNRLRRAAE